MINIEEFINDFINKQEAKEISKEIEKALTERSHVGMVIRLFPKSNSNQDNIADSDDIE